MDRAPYNHYVSSVLAPHTLKYYLLLVYGSPLLCLLVGCSGPHSTREPEEKFCKPRFGHMACVRPIKFFPENPPFPLSPCDVNEWNRGRNAQSCRESCSSSVGYSSGVQGQWLCQAMTLANSTGVMQADAILFLWLVPSRLTSLSFTKPAFDCVNTAQDTQSWCLLLISKN